MNLQEQCLQLLEDAQINPASTIDFDVNGEIHSLSLASIIDTYMQASEESKLVFYTALQKASATDTIGIEKFFEGMGQLFLMSHLSKKM